VVKILFALMIAVSWSCRNDPGPIARPSDPGLRPRTCESPWQQDELGRSSPLRRTVPSSTLCRQTASPASRRRSRSAAELPEPVRGEPSGHRAALYQVAVAGRVFRPDIYRGGTTIPRVVTMARGYWRPQIQRKSN
jgi:hypothetical protein